MGGSADKYGYAAIRTRLHTPANALVNVHPTSNFDISDSRQGVSACDRHRCHSRIVTMMTTFIWRVERVPPPLPWSRFIACTHGPDLG